MSVRFAFIFSRGFGRGILGRVAAPGGLANGFGSSEPKKFGSRGRGGLANKENIDSSEEVKPGFGSKPSFGSGGGFGSKRGGFGGGGGGDFSARSEQNDSSRGGFGGGRGGFGKKNVGSNDDDWGESESTESKPSRGFGSSRGGFGGGSGGDGDSFSSKPTRGFGSSRGGFGGASRGRIFYLFCSKFRPKIYGIFSFISIKVKRYHLDINNIFCLDN